IPSRVRIIPDAKKKIKEYLYRVNGKEISLPPETVLHLKYQDPLDEYYGIAPVFSAKNDVTLDFWMTSWAKSFFKKGTVPGGVLKTPQSLSDTAWSRLKATWNKFHLGPENAHSIAI